MKNWLNENLRKIIIGAFVVPILLVAFVSISHVTTFYGISNPITWAIYLSVGIEIAALSALAAVSVNMGRFVYVPFFIVTLIQMLGNIFFSFTFIDETGQTFQDWINMVGGLFENLGVEKTDLNTHKTVLSFLTGGLLPIISLTFAHMLVKFSEQESERTDNVVITNVDNDIKPEEPEIKFTPTEEQIETLNSILKNYSGPTQVIPNDEPVSINEDKLSKIENILNNYNNDVEEFIDEPKIEETISEIKEVFDEVKVENVVDEDVKENDIVIEQIPHEITEDKKKTDDTIETEKTNDYKVLSYHKNNG